MASFPAVLLDSGTFTEHRGIRICDIGEDGDSVALGHHDPAHVAAAFETFGRDRGSSLFTTWAVLTDPPDLGDETPPWCMQWGVSDDTPGAFPVTVAM
jgi:hypothetical protein